MPKPKPSRKKVITTDAAGVILIITSGAIGWLPGPGGIPLFFAGLRLLAENHEKPRLVLDYLIKNGFKLERLLFPEDKQIEIVWDIFTILSIAFGSHILINYGDTKLLYPVGVSYVVWGVLAIAYNRSRYKKAKKLYNRIFN